MSSVNVYNSNPKIKTKRGQGHMAYMSAKLKHKAKINIITHSKTFYGEPTNDFIVNPNRLSKDKRPSRFSIPV